jgi:hypothetical protein
MTVLGRLFASLIGASIVLVGTTTAAFAQSSIAPTDEPTRNTGGWVFWLAWLCLALALLLAVFLIAAYMRYAPRFSKDEDSARAVRADRVLPGQEPPRRMVDITQAVPIVAQPPAVPVAAASAAPDASPVAAAAPAPVAEPAPFAEAPAPAAAPSAQTAPVPAPQPVERPEVSLDQETFDRTLEELLAAGTDRRIAEGKARRAAMIAARKKAGG